MKRPQYTDRMLIRLIHETESREDLVKLSTLYVELSEQGDIVITHRMAHEMKAQEVHLNLRQRPKK